jgi:hypothetical protein
MITLKPISNLYRKSSSWLCLLATLCTASIAILDSKPAYAVFYESDKKFGSLEAFKNCRDLGGGGLTECTSVALYVDPIGDGIEDFSITLQYDPALWSFDQSTSGFTCQFASQGDCFPPSVSYGSSLVDSLIDPSVGNIASGGSYAISFPSPGSVKLDAVFGNPINVTSDTNAYAFSFTPTLSNSINLNKPLLATYSEQLVPGSSFIQSNWTCNTRLGNKCASNTPVPSLTLTEVPGPLPILGAAAAFGWSRKLRKRLKSSKSEVISTTAV